ncbi:ABC transporter H family member 2-like isoform X2 [Linepithema humile]|uniref:ABC transporter H family member 2-like isoform X2 n=1 Tax=Linepithema humile TaxID=83485 RepID=UPI00351E479C
MTNTSRGPYKKYLVDIVEEIPVTTIRSRRACFSAGREKQRIVEVEVPISDKLSNNENTKNHDIQDNDDSTINIEEYSNQFQDNAIRIDSDNETIVSRRSLGESNSSQADSDFSSENENNLEENYLNYSEDENSDNYNNDNVDIHKNKSDSESNEDNEEYENQIQDIIRVSIYEGCNLTKEESQLLIMGTAIRNKMTDVGLETLLKIVDCHLPHTQYNSKYHFLKTFPKKNVI